MSQEDNATSNGPSVDAKPEVLIELRTPHSDWELNQLLVDLNDELTEQELPTLKHIFSGDEGIGLRPLEKITTPLQLFKRMKGHGFLSRDNLIYLQKALMTIKRMDLVLKVVEYARQMGDTLHFYPAPDQPVNGYRLMTMHIDGKDFRSCTRTHLDTTRATLSRILMLPPERIIFAGVEPSSSLLITVMIPEDYLDMMMGFLKDGYEFPELQNIGVDIVMIDNLRFNVKGVEDAEIVETEQQAKLTTVYQQLQEKTKQLENADVEIIRLEKELDASSYRLESVKTTLRKILRFKSADDSKSDNSDTPEHETPKESHASSKKPDNFDNCEKRLNSFLEALNDAYEAGCDKAVIKCLLETQCSILTDGIGSFFRNRIQQLQLQVDSMAKQFLPLRMQLARYQFFSEKDIEKKLISAFEALTKDLIKLIPATQTIQLKEEYIQVLRQISRSLKGNEKALLAKDCEWGQEDKIKEIIDKDSNMLLAGLIYKEIEKRQAQIPYDDFILACLERVNRADLQKRYTELTKKLKFQPTENSQKNKKDRNKGSRDRNAKDDTEPQDPEFKPTFYKMADQVQFMHDTISSNLSAYDKDSYPFDTSQSFFPPEFAARFSQAEEETVK